MTAAVVAGFRSAPRPTKGGGAAGASSAAKPANATGALSLPALSRSHAAGSQHCHAKVKHHWCLQLRMQTGFTCCTASLRMTWSCTCETFGMINLRPVLSAFAFRNHLLVKSTVASGKSRRC